jgi:hypothetical protein
MHKAFWRILPLILVAYLFAYMDRVNVSFAAAAMSEDLAFSATVYGLGGGLFFLGYALFEIPSNLMLVRFWRTKVDSADHDHLGAPVCGHDVCANASAILHIALPAWCGRGGILPRRNFLLRGLVSAVPPWPCGQPLLHSLAAGVGRDGWNVWLAAWS